MGQNNGPMTVFRNPGGGPLYKLAGAIPLVNFSGRARFLPILGRNGPLCKSCCLIGNPLLQSNLDTEIAPWEQLLPPIAGK